LRCGGGHDPCGPQYRARGNPTPADEHALRVDVLNPTVNQNFDAEALQLSLGYSRQFFIECWQNSRT
jgi:hypothetical protein